MHWDLGGNDQTGSNDRKFTLIPMDLKIPRKFLIPQCGSKSQSGGREIFQAEKQFKSTYLNYGKTCNLQLANLKQFLLLYNVESD
jgi:hypothetical protein